MDCKTFGKSGESKLPCNQSEIIVFLNEGLPPENDDFSLQEEPEKIVCLKKSEVKHETLLR